MTQTERRGISASQKQELWERWKRGQSMNDIARALAKQRGSVHFVLSTQCGGSFPTLPRYLAECLPAQPVDATLYLKPITWRKCR